MIKILHVISDKNIGGAGKLLLNLLAKSDRKKFDTSVILPCGSLLTPRIKELNFQATETELSFCKLYRLIKIQKPDIVHAHSAATARMAAKFCGVPAILNTKHCAEEIINNIPLYKRASVHAFDALFTDCTIATAEYVKGRLIAEGIPSQKISVIINGSLPLRELTITEKSQSRAKLGYGDDDFIVGMVARLEHGKGHEYFIEAAKFCKENNPEIKFLIVGDGCEMQKLKAAAQGLDNVKFLGFVDNVSEIMNILDANVNCSYISETSSLSLSEGMSVGAVPIVSNCGGNSFMAKDCGIVFPKKNHRALAEALIFLSKNPKKKKNLSDKAKQRFHSVFTAKKMARETESLYLRLLK